MGTASVSTERTIEKDYTTFNTLTTNRENSEKLWRYTDALTTSICSIREDNSLDGSQKLQLMNQSLDQFHTAMAELCKEFCSSPADPVVEKAAPVYELIEEVQSVQKYNLNHDARGRFCSGSATGAISSRTITGGGMSVHVKSGREPKTGYMVAVYGERSQWLKGDEVTDPVKRESAIKAYMKKNADVLSDKNNFLGTWYDTSTGNISLDISRNFSNKKQAISFASKHNEKAIWDVENMTEIPTGGTGNNL